MGYSVFTTHLKMETRLIHFEERLRQSVKSFWRGRSQAATRQRAAGRSDQGNRGAVTSGKNMDGFREMVADVVRRYGPQGVAIHRDKSLVVLPGFYRPTKQWDVLVIHDRRLLAALELKSLCGPSFGNNANNRCEEALGSAADFRKAQSQGLLGPGASPFLGYFLLVEDAPESRGPVRAQSPHFPTDRLFQGASYQTRMRILCERMMEQQLYASASLLISPNDSSGVSESLGASTSFRSLLGRLAGHLAGEATANQPPTLEIREEANAAYGLLDGNLFEPIRDLE